MPISDNLLPNKHGKCLFLESTMTRRKRRNHSAEFKVKVALAAIKGDHTLAELSTQFDLHQTKSSIGKINCLSNQSIFFHDQQHNKNQRLTSKLYMPR
ncbi:hypothetical protein HADU_08991 [Acinetobacter sp. HA]|nr:hypothetical protein HADU_08991 [Acinetobacter sp. HA]